MATVSRPQSAMDLKSPPRLASQPCPWRWRRHRPRGWPMGPCSGRASTAARSRSRPASRRPPRRGWPRGSAPRGRGPGVTRQRPGAARVGGRRRRLDTSARGAGSTRHTRSRSGSGAGRRCLPCSPRDGTPRSRSAGSVLRVVTDLDPASGTARPTRPGRDVARGSVGGDPGDPDRHRRGSSVAGWPDRRSRRSCAISGRTRRRSGRCSSRLWQWRRPASTHRSRRPPCRTSRH